MLHICIRWIHDRPDEPVWLFSELDDRGIEHRKVTFWGDGSHARAAEGIEVGDAALVREPFPSLAILANDPQFEVHEISPAAFELVWDRVIAREHEEAAGATRRH